MSEGVVSTEPTKEESVSARGARVTQLLVETAEQFGLRAQTEYPIPGGRLDVVWLWRSSIPGVEGDLPIVAFEVESSWRTRKHLKGDLVNLQDACPLVGVIVLLGEGHDVESTRQFASQLVDRLGFRIVVWSEEDVDALIISAKTGEEDDLVRSNMDPKEVSAASAKSSLGPAGETEGHTGKYRPLWDWLRRTETSPVPASFVDVERVLAFDLPPSCRRHLPHWYGYSNTAVGRAIRDAGWRARNVNLERETVIFERVRDEESPSVTGLQW